jgi:hypothetical protein
VGDLWLQEMDNVEAVLSKLAPNARLAIMTDAVEYAMFQSLTPLSFVMTGESAFLVESAVDVVRKSQPQARIEELDEKIAARVNDEASVASIMLVNATYFLAGLSDPPRSADAVEVLFNCYDATMQRQGFGRTVTLENELSSEACLDVIRQQKALVHM